MPKIEKGSRIDVALMLLNQGERLLDVGCGSGTLGYFVKKLKRYKEVYGIDLFEKALKIAKKRGLLIKKVDLDKSRFPFKRNYFDAATCLDVLEHLIDPRKTIKEIHRVLKTNGILIISTPNMRYWHHLLTLVFKGRFPKTSADTRRYNGGHLHYFTYKDIEELLKTNGFTTLKKQGVFGKNFMKEFLSPGVIIKARKR